MHGWEAEGGDRMSVCKYSAQPRVHKEFGCACLYSYAHMGPLIDNGEYDNASRQLDRRGGSGSCLSFRHSADAVIESDEVKGVLGVLNACRKKAGPCLVC